MGACYSNTAASAPFDAPQLEPEMMTGSLFTFRNPNQIDDVYDMEEAKLGEGAYGVVRKGQHRSTRTTRAIKLISKKQVTQVEKFRAEIDIMSGLDHPNIIKLFETFEDQKNIYLAMELCTGGELFDRIIDAGKLGEREAAVVVQQILRPILYMHQQHICHRDLKPENFLLMTTDPISKNLLKIIDFGLSCRFTRGTPMTTRAGTPFYVAPQVLAGKYDHRCDLWSIGVIMYILLCGYPPFQGRNDQEVLGKIRKGEFRFPEKDWDRVSDQAKYMIKRLLRKNPKGRYTAQEGLQDEWILGTAPSPPTHAFKANPNLVQNLRTFRTENKLKKAALQIIASHLDEGQLRGLRDTFTALDADNDGRLTLEELTLGLDAAGLSRRSMDFEAIVAGMDTDGSGVVDYTEYIAAALDRRSCLSEQACWTAFKVFDLNGDGRISLEELRQVLKRDTSEELSNAMDTAALLQDVDTDGNGMIDFQEFMDMMKGGIKSRGKDFMGMLSSSPLGSPLSMGSGKVKSKFAAGRPGGA